MMQKLAKYVFIAAAFCVSYKATADTPWIGQPYWDTASMSVSASSEFNAGFNPLQTVAGYESTFHDSFGLHNNNSTGYGMWLSGFLGGGSSYPSPSGTPGAAWIAYDFGEVYQLTSLRIWNYNQFGATNRGLRNVTIDYTDDGIGWQTLGSFVIPQATGLDQMPYTIDINLAGIPAQKMVIVAQASNGSWGVPYYGLSEVRFYGQKKPSLIEPVPPHNATCMETDAPLGWNPVSGGLFYEVYAGTNYTAVRNAQRLAGDLDGSGIVDWDDALVLAENWLQTPSVPWLESGSPNHLVDFTDFAVIAEQWMLGVGADYRARLSNPGITLDNLAGCTNYYWRVDTLSQSGVTKGQMYSFKTHCGQALPEYYVSPDGDDANPGTLESPFKTLDKARNAVRGLCTPAGGTTIYLRGGTYFRSGQFYLDAADSGRAGSPVIYRSFPGEEARIIGGAPLSPNWFSVVDSSSPIWNRLPAAARGSVYVCDLAANGITNYGTFNDNFNRPDIYFNRQRMQIARWPNSGYAQTLSGDNNTTFRYSGTQPSNWLTAPDAWAAGYWGYGWHLDYRLVSSINTSTQRITLQSPVAYGIGGGKLWWVTNLIEELDASGEWYLDRSSGKLYLWPPSSINGAEIVMSMLGTVQGTMVQTNGTKYLEFRDLTFEMCRFRAIQLGYGEQVLIDSCRVQNTGEYAMTLSGKNHTVQNSIIRNTGGAAIYVSGGDRPKLEPGGHRIRNNRIYDFGYWQRIYTPGVWLVDVGATVEHNVIYNGPHFGIYHTGNNHTIRYNEFYNLCYEVDDAGVIYGGRDWGYRGNRIQNNLFRNISTIQPTQEGIFGVYLDDCYSSVDVVGNIFYSIAGRAFVIGGGRDNLFENNVIAKCSNVLYMDRRGLTWAPIGQGDPSWDLLGKIQAMNYTQPPWSVAYPALAAILNEGWDQAKAPKGNRVRKNIGWQNGTWSQGDGLSYLTSENNITNQNPLFADESSTNLALRDDSPAYTIPGFVRIPFELIGNLDMTLATRPNPHNGRTGIPTTAKLFWAPALDAPSRDVYIGTDYNAVFHATTSSPEFKTNTANTSFDSGMLNAGQTYYWRIDERDENGNVLEKGTVWQFTTQ